MECLDFVPTEKPDWRRTSLKTSTMIEQIVEYYKRFENLPEESKSWVYSEQALAEFLFQVNKIEKEGFDTYPETQEAISKGALKLAESEEYTPQEDHRLESLCCLYRALRHWWTLKPKLCIEELEKSHELLLGSTQKEIAGRIRSKEDEVAYVNTEDGIHVFMWPTKVRSALEKLLKKITSLVSDVQSYKDLKSRTEALLKLGGCFFLEFENIHPFLDGNGRSGRILLAYLLRSVMPFPNVFLVDRDADYGLPPFVAPVYYYDCFQSVQSKKDVAVENGRFVFTEESSACELGAPTDLTALVIEGVYVGWKRFFQQLESKQVSTEPPCKLRRLS